MTTCKDGKPRRAATVAAMATVASALTLIVAAPLLAQASSVQTWPTKRVQVIVPFSPPGTPQACFLERCSSTCRRRWAGHHHRKPAGRRRRGWFRRQGGAGRAHHPGPFQRARDRAGDPADALRSGAGLRRHHAARQRASGAGDLAEKNIKTLKELVAAAKAKPGSINYAAAGIGTPASDHGALPPGGAVRGPARSLQRCPRRSPR